VLFIHITRLASNEIFSPSNKIRREVGRVYDGIIIVCLLYRLNTPKMYVKFWDITSKFFVVTAGLIDDV
jgi:hypothetical protein